MNTVYMETLGCAKNRVDSEIMLGILVQNSFEYVEDPTQAEVIIINTCGFLTAAVEESIEKILDLSNQKKDGVCRSLIVAGCMTERYKDDLIAEIPEIDGILGTSDYTQILPCVRDSLERRERKNYFSKRPLYSENNLNVERIHSTDRYYAYLKISEGCSNMCSFCNIPFLRGKFRSRPIPHIIGEFKDMVSKGIREINIISQDSSSYGFDLPKENNLLNLVRTMLDSSDEEFWLRIFYSYPNRYPLELAEIMAKDRRLTPYVDMPFQHFSDKTLKDMHRRIDGKYIESIIDGIFSRCPDAALRTTFIVGFPTETDKDFQELVKFVEMGYFTHIGVFTYSHEDNIRSSKYGDPVPEEVKEERKNILMEIQKDISLNKNKARVGTTEKVLVTGYSDETDLLLEGRTAFQSEDVDGVVYINEGQADKGGFYNVKITDAHPYDLVGSVIS